MSERWSVVQSDLKRMTIEHRRMLVFMFTNKHPRLSDPMIKALREVVINLQPQAHVARKLNLHRQAINRIVKQFTAYLAYL
jgi:hypothetical protein